jgi:hypothetical protein
MAGFIHLSLAACKISLSPVAGRDEFFAGKKTGEQR